MGWQADARRPSLTSPFHLKKIRLIELDEKGRGMSGDEKAEYHRLRHEIQQEEDERVPRLTCCETIRDFPSIYFVAAWMDGDQEVSSAHWQVTCSDSLYSKNIEDRRNRGLPSIPEGRPEAKVCPFCATPVPEMEPIDPRPVDVCFYTDGGYYCDVCCERLMNCICLPPSARYRVKRSE